MHWLLQWKTANLLWRMFLHFFPFSLIKLFQSILFYQFDNGHLFIYLFFCLQFTLHPVNKIPLAKEKPLPEWHHHSGSDIILEDKTKQVLAINLISSVMCCGVICFVLEVKTIYLWESNFFHVILKFEKSKKGFLEKKNNVSTSTCFSEVWLYITTLFCIIATVS